MRNRFQFGVIGGAMLAVASLPLSVAHAQRDNAARIGVPLTGTMVANAAMNGDVATLRSLIAKSANVNTPQGDGMTALHWAAERGDLAMTELLLAAGAKISPATRIGSYTPLHIASRNGHTAIVKALLKSGANANVMAANGATPLHLAAQAGSADAINALVAAKANIDAKESEWGQTPLMFAAGENRSTAIAALLKNHANPAVVTLSIDLTERSSRESAAAKKRNEVLWSFVPQSQRDSLQKVSTALAAAGQNATVQAAGQAAQPAQVAGASPAEPGQGGGRQIAPGRQNNAPPPEQFITPAQMQQAIAAGREVLLSPNAGPITVNADTTDGQVAGFEGTVGAMGGMSALHHAVRQGNLAAVAALIDGGADINQRTVGDSTTPLLLAAINGQFDVAMWLVKRGADVKLASSAGTTPLYAAINAMYLPRSRYPQPQAVQNQKTTHIELMEAMINAGADVNVRLKKNLWYFGYNNCGNANCGLEYLDGTTPFWRAAYAVDVEAMKMLKSHGADPSIPSFRVVAARGGRGGGGRGGAAVNAAPATAAGSAGAAGTTATGTAATGTTAADSALARGFAAGRGAGRGAAGAVAGAGGPDGPGGPPTPLDPAIDSAAKAVPPGIGVYAIHAAAGVGYGNGFAGNSHRHVPDGWMPAIKYLVEELHADVNQRDLNGYTPLHHAAARGDNDMIKYLVSKGADVKAVARNGRTTVDMANGPVQRLRPYPETITLLEKLGAKNSHKCVSC